MSNSELWQKFLNNIKDVISSMSFDIWFNEEDTKLYSFKDNVATITVNQDFIKKHIRLFCMQYRRCPLITLCGGSFSQEKPWGTANSIGSF